jgi:hypothetical protein
VDSRDILSINLDPADEVRGDQYLEQPHATVGVVEKPLDYPDSVPILDEAPAGASAQDEPDTESSDASEDDRKYAYQNTESAEPEDGFEESGSGSESETSDEYEESSSGSESASAGDYEEADSGSDASGDYEALD